MHINKYVADNVKLDVHGLVFGFWFFVYFLSVSGIRKSALKISTHWDFTTLAPEKVNI